MSAISVQRNKRTSCWLLREPEERALAYRDVGNRVMQEHIAAQWCAVWPQATAFQHGFLRITQIALLTLPALRFSVRKGAAARHLKLSPDTGTLV